MKTTLRTHSVPLLVLVAMALALALGWQPDALASAGALMVLATTVAPFPVTPQLAAIALAYRNVRLIADDVLPRVPVGAQNFKYLSYPKGTFLTPPDTRVARKGAPNTVEFSATEIESSTFDEALDDEVPFADVQNAANQPGMPNPLMRATEGITDLLALRREVRAAALVFAAGTYASGNKVQLAGNDQWSVVHADSNPIPDIMTGLDACIMRPSVMVIGRAAYKGLVMNAAMVKAYNGSTGDTGIVPRQFVADLFELEEILVGDGWLNTAKKGQTVVAARTWGKHCALIYRNKQADMQRGTTFGVTAQWGARFAGSKTDPDIGMRGGERVRVGESVRELIMANDLGYYIEDAVA